MANLWMASRRTSEWDEFERVVQTLTDKVAAKCEKHID